MRFSLYAPFRDAAILLLLVFSSCVPAAHNQPAAKANGKPPAQSSDHTDEMIPKPTDSMGRSTPHGALFGFLQAAQSGKYDEAAQYLQLSKRERAANGERLARQLHELMDQVFVGRIGTVSDNPKGSPQSGVPQDRERIGVFRINDIEKDVELVHVSDPAAGSIWLFSSGTLADVPQLFSQIEESKIESELPRFLVAEQVFSTPLWRWIAFLLLILPAFALSWGIVRLLRRGIRAWMRWRPHPMLQDLHDSVAAPAKLVLTIIFHSIGVVFLGLPLLIRGYYGRFAGIILTAGVAWLVFRLINHWAERARAGAAAGSSGSSSMVVLGQRLFKAVVVVVTVLIMLSMFGVNITAAVAGLGIGSIAIAFAAQKTLENLLGGISILGDQVIRVGDTCRVGEKVGTVEDISLRSTRIRTLDSTELSVPNGQLANMSIENLSRYDKSSFRTTIELQRETSPDQLRSLLARMRELLRHDSRVDPDVARVRLIGFGESSLDVEIYCHILTGSSNEFLAIREDLLLRIMDLIAEAGTQLALPSRALHLAQEETFGQQTAPALKPEAFKRRHGS